MPIDGENLLLTLGTVGLNSPDAFAIKLFIYQYNRVIKLGSLSLFIQNIAQEMIIGFLETRNNEFQLIENNIRDGNNNGSSTIFGVSGDWKNKMKISMRIYSLHSLFYHTDQHMQMHVTENDGYSLLSLYLLLYFSFPLKGEWVMSLTPHAYIASAFCLLNLC